MFRLVKLFVIFLSVLVSFLAGISAGHLKHFPFSIIYKLKNGTDYVAPSHDYRGRNYDAQELPLVEILNTEDVGFYLTYGQSNSVNSGELGYRTEGEVYQFVLGNTFDYQDPSLGGTGVGGSVWGMVGDELIRRGVHGKVIFANSGWGGKKIEDLKDGPFFEFLFLNYVTAIKKYGKVDAILFHQGESNNSEDGVINYYSGFSDFLQNLEKHGIKVPVYLSRASFCSNRYPVNIELTDIQNKLIGDYAHVHAGPNSDLLVSKIDRREDNCHFSLAGNQKLAKMWVEAILSNSGTERH